MPIPASERFETASEALLVTARVALKLPTVLGENETLMVAACPAAIVTGRLGAFREKYWVEMAALLTVIAVSPVLDAVTVMVLLLPAGTLPKSRLDVAKERTLESV